MKEASVKEMTDTSFGIIKEVVSTRVLPYALEPHIYFCNPLDSHIALNGKRQYQITETVYF